MVRASLGVVFLLAACRSDLSLLEHEMIVFRAESEGARVEALKADYERDRKRADELSAELLLLAREREELYERYDRLSADVAGLKRSGAARARELAALGAQASKLESRLAREQKEHERLKTELADLLAKRRALEAKKRGTKTPE